VVYQSQGLQKERGKELLKPFVTYTTPPAHNTPKFKTGVSMEFGEYHATTSPFAQFHSVRRACPKEMATSLTSRNVYCRSVFGMMKITFHHVFFSICFLIMQVSVSDSPWSFGNSRRRSNRKSQISTLGIWSGG
jgi:hypothetical protein